MEPENRTLIPMADVAEQKTSIASFVPPNPQRAWRGSAATGQPVDLWLDRVPGPFSSVLLSSWLICPSPVKQI